MSILSEALMIYPFIRSERRSSQQKKLGYLKRDRSTIKVHVIKLNAISHAKISIRYGQI